MACDDNAHAVSVFREHRLAAAEQQGCWACEDLRARLSGGHLSICERARREGRLLFKHTQERKSVGC